ncbi:MAG TPA: cytochrome C oxidase subunit IV family protein [Phycisphaerae bacterium]|nr:cytochrome C oxidase subunit IV family protein [Phycisphaerae bacterium]
MTDIPSNAAMGHPVPPPTPGDFAPATPPPHSNEEFGGHPTHGVGHIVPLRVLVTIFVSLVCLTIITYLASLVNFGEMNLVVALAIAVVKSSLVVLYFMHLRWDKPFNSIVFVGCLIFVALFISLSMLDSHQYHSTVWNQQAEKVKHRVLLTAENEPGAQTPTAVPPANPNVTR